MNTISSFFDHMRQRHTRRIAAIVIGIIALGSWGLVGTKIIASLNPTLKHELTVAMHPALDVWIASPDYAHVPPMIISTPAGVRFEHETIIVPEGSVISAHLAEQDGDAPELIVDGDRKTFAPDTHGDFAATQVLENGDRLVIRRGWLTLASWKIHVVADAPPKVAMVEVPQITEGKAVRISYTASDDLGVREVALRITPHDPLPGADNNAVEIPLTLTPAKQIARVDFEDLTARPWAGQKVSMQIVAVNESGKRSVSAPVDFTLPQRSFMHPIARVLIEERKKLLLNPDNQALREEVANIMASIAHEAANYRTDPVIMMALRSGAVRLILNHDHDSAVAVNDTLWESATRIEDGSSGQAQRMLRDARQDLANAINRNAGAQEIGLLTDRLQQAMTHFIAKIPAHPAPFGEAHSQLERRPIR